MEGKKIPLMEVVGILFVIAFAVLVMIRLNSPISLSYDSAIQSIEEKDGNVLITFDKLVAGHSIAQFEGNYTINCWSSVLKLFGSKEREITIGKDEQEEPVKTIFYDAHQEADEDLLVYDAQERIGETSNSSMGTVTLPRYVLNAYFFLAILCSVVGMLVSFCLRKTKAFKLAWSITLVPILFVGSCILVLWGRDARFYVTYYFGCVLIMTGLLYIPVRMLLNRKFS